MHIYIYLQNLLSVHNKSKSLAVITNYSVSQLLSHSLFFHFFEQRSSESSVGISIERGGGACPYKWMFVSVGGGEGRVINRR